MRMSSRYEIYWLVGILEGEGSFVLKADGGVRVKVASSDKDVIERVVTIAGIGAAHGPYKRKQRDGHKDMWEWYINGPKAIGFMLKVRRLMSIRRQEQIERCLSGYKDGWVYAIKDAIG